MKFLDVYRRGIYNNNLRKLLMLHDLPLISIDSLKTAVHHYQTRLLTYARSTPNIDPSATAGLGTMQHEITNQKQETIRGIQRWRTYKTNAIGHGTQRRRYSNKAQQYISRPESGMELSLASTSGRARPLANSGVGPQEMARIAQATKGGQVNRPYISTPHQDQAASSPPAAAEAGLLPKLSSE